MLSAVVITYNAEIDIANCLQSLTFADEIIVLDSFSTDRTLEIARQFTDKVSSREFTGFSNQWNAAIDLAQHEWILMVGADEVLTDGLISEIQYAVEKGACDGYRMPRLTYFLNRPIRGCGWYPDYQLRLARKSKFRIPHRLVHETMEIDGKCGTLKNDIIHFSYRSLGEYVRKMSLYARSAAEQKQLEGRKFHITDLLFTPGLTFLKMYILKQGFRDGLHGFILCALTQCSVFLRYAMLWEMTMRSKESKE